MLDWRAVMATALVELALTAGGVAALAPAPWGWIDDFPVGGECLGGPCTATPPRLVVFDIPTAQAVRDDDRVGIASSSLCPPAAPFDRAPRLIEGDPAPPSDTAWSVCLRIDARGAVALIGHIEGLVPIDLAEARRFAASLRFAPARAAGHPRATWIRLQVRASDALERLMAE